MDAEYGDDGLYGVSAVKLRRVVELEVPVHLVRGDVVVPGAVPPRGLEQRVGADEIGVNERARVIERVVVVALRGEMHNEVRRRHQGVYQLAVGDVPLCERQSRVDGQRRLVTRVGEVVEHGDLGVGPRGQA